MYFIIDYEAPLELELELSDKIHDVSCSQQSLYLWEVLAATEQQYFQVHVLWICEYLTPNSQRGLLNYISSRGVQLTGYLWFTNTQEYFAIFHFASSTTSTSVYLKIVIYFYPVVEDAWHKSWYLTQRSLYNFSTDMNNATS